METQDRNRWQPVQRSTWPVVTALLFTGVVLSGPPVLAHGGGLNAEGCHTNRSTGDYHCHRSPAPEYQPAPARRSWSARSAFRSQVPCPSTGRTTGRCPGYEVDHVVPLACGGADHPGNMQWLTREANRRKGDMGCSRR